MWFLCINCAIYLEIRNLKFGYYTTHQIFSSTLLYLTIKLQLT